MISWISRKQSYVALSIAEAKYVEACLVICDAVWLRKLLFDLFDLHLDATCIYCDNQSCVKLSENLVFHEKSKHIKIKYHYIKDMVQGGALKLQYVAMEKQIANMLTKPLALMKFEYLGRRLVFSKSRFLPRGSDESMSHSNMVRGLVPSMIRYKGCCHSWNGGA